MHITDQQAAHRAADQQNEADRLRAALRTLIGAVLDKDLPLGGVRLGLALRIAQRELCIREPRP